MGYADRQADVGVKSYQPKGKGLDEMSTSIVAMKAATHGNAVPCSFSLQVTLESKHIPLDAPVGASCTRHNLESAANTHDRDARPRSPTQRVHPQGGDMHLTTHPEA